MMANRNGARVQSLYQEPVYRTRQNRGDWNAASSSASSRVDQRNKAFRFIGYAVQPTGNPTLWVWFALQRARWVWLLS